jgi:hypothetical protein
MRLAAVYINDHFLFDEPQTLNFGGKFIFEFGRLENNEIKIDIVSNSNFTDKFWGPSVSLMSAIVGANGSGKTSILKVINKGYLEYTKAIFIYENEDDNGILFSVDNRTGSRDEAGQFIKGTGLVINFPTDISFSEYNPSGFTELYFSPIFDTKTEDFFSPLSLNSSRPEKSITEIFSQNIRKDITFLNTDVSATIKKIYPDFPSYESLKISAKKLHKRDFTKVYIDTNLGNPKKNETLKYEIEKDLRLKNFSNPQARLNSYLGILTNSNITDALQEIWNMPPYKNTNQITGHLTNDSQNFIKNIEINILSFLMLNDTYMLTELTGSYDFQRILDSNSFDEILNKFLAKYIIQIDKHFYENDDEINIDNYTELMEKVQEKYSFFEQLSGIKTEVLKTNIIHNINGFAAIKNLHNIFTSLSDFIVFEGGKSVLKIDVHRKDIESLMEALFTNYARVREYFSNIPISIIDIIDIESNKNLSYGEKSILNLYSTFYDFTLNNNHIRESENYLLILDEADLGYHPIWKRKFIYTLNESLPLIFSKMTPKVWDDINKKRVNSKHTAPKIQIIIATHDPLTLSDFPRSNVIYLKKNNNGKALVLNSKIDKKKSFGANITDLLADSFFVEDGLIGDFAKEKIEQTIIWLNEQKLRKDALGSSYTVLQVEVEYHESIIKIIDEPVIKIKLAEMLDELNNQTEVQKELIQREIDLLSDKLRKL